MNIDWHNIDTLNSQLLFGVCVFGAATTLAYLLVAPLLRAGDNPLAQRLRGAGESRPPPSEGGIGPIMQRLSAAAAKPLLPKRRDEQSRLRKRLGFAGFYTNSAMHIFVGSKILIMAAGALGGFVAGLMVTEYFALTVWMSAMCGLLGYMLPTIWLSLEIRRRQWALQTSLPDALDLMVVCVEAGLTIDAAIQRVGQEIALAHADISRELGITHMETRLGVSRIDALRNLGKRTGSAPLQSLAAMLVQAEKFGTSIGQALRVHADSLRVKRQHLAEEKAAKTTVKLAFPVVLFIFPTVIMVLGGPAFILLFKSPLFSGTN
ncbi:MAG: type II secretion system F family protein [Tepidisphaeraceae bacterium]